MSIVDTVLESCIAEHSKRGELVVPNGIKPVVGTVSRAYLSNKKYFKDTKSRNAARSAGVSYEKAAKEKLLSVWRRFDPLPGPWIEFRDASGFRICQPDFVVVCPLYVVIFEIKIRHTEVAWWQLRRLYAPVCERLWGRPAACVEFTQSFDPSTFFPESESMIVTFSIEDMLERIPHIVDGRVLVNQWKRNT